MAIVPETARRILTGFRRIAVVGLSDRPDRPSHEVSSYLLRAGYDVVPVNPSIREALGRRSWPSLREVPPPPVEVVDIFRRPEHVGAIVDEAIAIGARAVWMQDGVVDEAAAERARAAGLLVVMDRCMLRDHRALGLG